MSNKTVLTLAINPEPWTSPTASVGRRHGKIVPFLHADAALKAYEAAVAEEAQIILGDDWQPYDGPIKLEFYFWRRLVKYITGAGKTNTKKRVDVTNMQKSAEDALQGVLFTNDRNVVGIESWVMEQDAATRAGMVVVMRTDFKVPQVEIDWEAIDLEGERRPQTMVQDFDVESIF